MSGAVQWPTPGRAVRLRLRRIGALAGPQGRPNAKGGHRDTYGASGGYYELLDGAAALWSSRRADSAADAAITLGANQVCSTRAAEVVAAVPPRTEGAKETAGSGAGVPISPEAPASATPAGADAPTGFERCSGTLTLNEYRAPKARQGGNDGSDVLLRAVRAGGRVRAHGVRAAMSAAAVLHNAAPRRRDAVLRYAAGFFVAVKWTNCAPTAQSEHFAIQNVERTMRKTQPEKHHFPLDRNGAARRENGRKVSPMRLKPRVTYTWFWVPRWQRRSTPIRWSDSEGC